MNIYVLIEGGCLTDVYTDGDPNEINLELVDYDIISKCDNSIEAKAFADEVERGIRDGSIRACW